MEPGGKQGEEEEFKKNEGEEEEELLLDLVLQEADEGEHVVVEVQMGRHPPDMIVPMDSNVLTARPSDFPDSSSSKEFSKERVFEAAYQGDAAQLAGLQDFLLANCLQLTSPEFVERANGKTALLKALMNLKDGTNETVPLLLEVAKKCGDLDSLVNAAYQDIYFKGQTALHIAIERRSFDLVKLLVQNGADVQARADGRFFQREAGMGFYFGELPLSLAACTNQPEVVSFLLDNPHRRATLEARDSQGNTVLHTLVIIADNTPENTDMVAAMYDLILLQHSKQLKAQKVKALEMEVNGQLEKPVMLEDLENNRGLTSMKLAAKLGKIGLFQHILQREFLEEEAKPLCRKFTEWSYGPVHSSLYNMSAIDTDEKNSVLEIIVFGSEIPNRPEMLKLEPLNSLLQDKWDRVGSKSFLLHFLFYLIYVSIFTAVAYNRRDGTPPFPIETGLDHARLAGEIFSVLGAVWFLYKAILIFRKNPPTFTALYTDGFYDILFFLQAVLLLVCFVLYVCGRREYVGFLVLSLALAWINILYYSRGSRQMGIYSVMIQRMILGDILTFLCVYSVLLVGFSAAVVALIEDPPPGPASVASPTNGSSLTNASTTASSPDGDTLTFDVETLTCKRPSYDDISYTVLELFKFTIGMGNLEFTDHVQYEEVFYILLIFYIVLTYILLLNMLIALMGNTVELIAKETENIWNLQRAFTILDMERSLPRCLRRKVFGGESKMVCLRGDKNQKFFRVEEMDWIKWRSDLAVVQEVDPENQTLPPIEPHTRNLWNLSPMLEKIRARQARPRHQHPRQHHPLNMSLP